MALTEKLELLLTADPSQGISALHQLSSEAEKTAKASESSLSRIGTAAMKVGVGGIGVGGFLTQMASGDIEAANQLSAAIGQVGQAQSDFKDRVDETVSAMAKYGATDEQVKGSLTTLTIAYGDTGKAIDEMQLVADLAARKNEDLGTAATQVARAHGGATKIFKEFGVQVGLNADGTKDYDGALTQLAQKLSGQADASANSWAGRLRELRAEATNLVSEFGQNFGPMILGVSTLMTGAGAAFSGAAALMNRFKGATEESTVATEANTEAQGASKLAIAGGGVAVAAAVVGLYAYGQSLNNTTAKVGDFAKLSDQSWDQQTQTALKLIDVYKGPFAGSVDSLIQHYRDLGPAGVEELGRIRDALAASGKDTSKFDAAIQGATQSEQNMAPAVDATNTKLETQAQRFTDIASAADKAFEAQLKLAPADVRVREGALQVASAKDKQAKAEQDLVDAQASGDPKKIADAVRSLDEANLNYTQTVLDEATAVEDLKETQDAANGITDSASDKTLGYLNALSFLNAGLTGPTHDALNQYIWDTTVAYNKTKDLENAALGNAGLAPAPFHDLSKSAANRATGGSGYPGSTYFIEPGTKGEYFTPTQSGWFTPSDKTSGGGYTVHIGQIVTADPLEAGDQVARRLRVEAMLASP